MRMWPKLTKVQRVFLMRLESSTNGSLRCPVNRAYLRLVYEGMVTGQTIISNFAIITQRGRDYVRFGIRRRA